MAGTLAGEEGTGQRGCRAADSSSPSIPCIEKLFLSLFPPSDRPNSPLRPPCRLQRLRELEFNCGAEALKYARTHCTFFHQGNEFGRLSTFLKMHRRDTRRRWEPKDVLDAGPLLSPKSLYLRPFKSNWIAQGEMTAAEEREGRRSSLPTNPTSSVPW